MIESTDLTEEETARWQDAEEAVIQQFQNREMEPNEAMNVITHILARMAVLMGCEKEDLLAGVSETFDHTVESFMVSPEDFH
jgi:hypothetical protein